MVTEMSQAPAFQPHSSAHPIAGATIVPNFLSEIEMQD